MPIHTGKDAWAYAAKRLLGEPDIAVGARALVRSVLNLGIAIGDLFPGYGLVLSGGADVAKVIAKVELEMRRRYVRWVEKGNPDDVKASSIDLTPDVKLRLAVGSELLELFSVGLFPTHAIEGGIQLYHDWPRMKRALKRAREIVSGQPGGVIDVEFTTKE